MLQLRSTYEWVPRLWKSCCRVNAEHAGWVVICLLYALPVHYTEHLRALCVPDDAALLLFDMGYCDAKDCGCIWLAPNIGHCDVVCHNSASQK